MRKKKAIDLIGEKTDQNEITELLLDAEFSLEEIKEVLTELTPAPGASNTPGGDEPPPPPPIVEDKKHDPSNPNASLDLSGFNYKELKGAKFREYVELVGDKSYVHYNTEEGTEETIPGKLLQNDLYDFQLFRVVPIMKDRFPGMRETPRDYIGLKIKDDAPIHTTRITVKTALEHNAQILNAHSIAGHGKYYFLKK